MITSPLAWPMGRAKTQPYERPEKLETRTASIAYFALEKALKAAGATKIIVSSNLPPNRDRNKVLSNVTGPGESPGVSVTFTLSKKNYLIARDGQRIVADNIYACMKIVEALRLLDKYADRYEVGEVWKLFEVTGV